MYGEDVLLERVRLGGGARARVRACMRSYRLTTRRLSLAVVHSENK